MEPAGDFPSTPFLREFLEQGDYFPVPIVPGELESRIAHGAVGQGEAQDDPSLTEFDKLFTCQLQHGGHLILGEEFESIVTVHEFTPVNGTAPKEGVRIV